MSVRAVLFDLGHTLWDVRYDEALAIPVFRSVRRRLARAGKKSLPSVERLREAITKHWAEEELDVLRNKRLDQRPPEDLIAEGLATLGIRVSQSVLEGITDDVLLPDAWGHHIQVDTVSALRTLQEEGVKLGIVSNTFQRGDVLRDQLAECGALQYMSVTVFSSEMGLRKPHPALFQTPLAELGVPPQEAVFVGDSLQADIRGAQGIGMRAVLTRQYRQESAEGVTPDHVISRLPDIIDYVDTLNFGLRSPT